jgi:hypothetical protein
MDDAAVATSIETPSDSSTGSLEAAESLENDQTEELSDDEPGSQPRPDSSQKKPVKKDDKPAEDDDEEEIVIGRTKARVKKDVAKALKDLERGAQARLEEAAHERRRAAQLLHLAKTNPDKFFELTGIDADKFAESRLAKQYERMTMSPEARELAEYKEREARQIEDEMASKADVISEIEDLVGAKAPDEIKKLPKERLTQILEQQRAKRAEDIKTLDGELGEAWKESGLPKNKLFVQWIAATMRNYQLAKNQPLQAKEAAAIVKQEVLQSVSEICDSFEDPQGILDFLGTKTVKRIQEYLVARATGKIQRVNASENSNGPGRAPETQKLKHPKAMNEFEYREYMRSLANELRD